MEKNSHDFTRDELEFVRLYELDMTADYIAEHMGLSLSQVYRLRRQTGMPRWETHHVPVHCADIPEAELRNLMDSPLKQSEIAQHFGVHRSVISRRAMAYGITREPRHSPRRNAANLDREELEQLIRSDATTAQLCDRFSVSKTTIMRYVHKYELPMPRVDYSRPPRPEPDIDRELVRELTKHNHSARQIAEQLGCSMRSVTRIRRELGLSFNHGNTKFPPEVRAKALEMLEGGASYNDTARTLGMKDGTLRKWFPGMGWSNKQAVEYRHMLHRLEDIGAPADRRRNQY